MKKWKKMSTITEIPVGLEINAYACPEISASETDATRDTLPMNAEGKGHIRRAR